MYFTKKLIVKNKTPESSDQQLDFFCSLIIIFYRHG